MQKKPWLKSHRLFNCLIPYAVLEFARTNRQQRRVVRKNFHAASLRAGVIAGMTLFLSSPVAFAQESVWSSEYEMAESQYAEKNFGDAEKMLNDAVKEAEKLPKTGKQLLKTLLLLYKVYTAQNNADGAAQVAERVKSLGGTIDSAASSQASGATSNAASSAGSKLSSSKTGENSVDDNFLQFDLFQGLD